MTHTSQEIRVAGLEDAREMIKHNMTVDNQWLLRGLLAIFEHQTADEQRVEITDNKNFVGFSASDAKMLTGFAKQVIAWQQTPVQNRRFNNPLSPRQWFRLRERMMKYSRQLARLVLEKSEEAKKRASEEVSRQLAA